MDSALIAKDIIGIQKQSFNNFMDTMILFQDQAEMTGRRWANQMGFGEKAKKISDQWLTVFNKGRDDSRKLINDGFDGMEEYFAGLEQKKSPEK
jgi:hypothetical protein